MSNFGFSSSFDCFTDEYLDSETNILKRLKFAKSVANTPRAIPVSSHFARQKFCPKAMMKGLNYVPRDLP